MISERIADTIASKSRIPALGTLCDKDGKPGPWVDLTQTASEAAFQLEIEFFESAEKGHQLST